MAERIVEVGVPPETRKEIVDYFASGDPVVKEILLSESGKVTTFLIKKGYLKCGEGVQIRFISNPDVSLDSLVRPVAVIDAVVDTDGHLIKLGNPVDVMEFKTPISIKN